MKIILSDEDIIKLVYNAFVDGGLSEFGQSDIELRWFDRDYNHAKEILKSNPQQKDTICYEDVLVQLFKDGKLVFIDHNDDRKHEFTPALVTGNLNELLAGDDMNKQAAEEILKSLDDDSSDADAWTHYNILQFMLFKELVYG